MLELLEAPVQGRWLDGTTGGTTGLKLWFVAAAGAVVHCAQWLVYTCLAWDGVSEIERKCGTLFKLRSSNKATTIEIRSGLEEMYHQVGLSGISSISYAKEQHKHECGYVYMLYIYTMLYTFKKLQVYTWTLIVLLISKIISTKANQVVLVTTLLCK